MQNTFFKSFLFVFQVVVLRAARDVLRHVFAFICLSFLSFQCFLYSGMVLITVLLCVAGLCGSTMRPLTRSHWLMRSFTPSLCHSSVFLIYIHSHPITPPLKRPISFHTFSLSLSIEFVQPDHPHKPDISRHSLLLFVLSMYYSSRSVNESQWLIHNSPPAQEWVETNLNSACFPQYFFSTEERKTWTPWHESE